MRKNKLYFLTFSFLLISLPFFANSQDNFVSTVYFTGVGCPHCAKTDPVILEKLLKENPNFIVLEYEIYQTKENALVLDKYCEKLDLPYCKLFGPYPCCGIPLIIFGEEKKDIIVGDDPILENVKEKIKESTGNKFYLLDGSFSFENLEIVKIPGYPKIWKGDRILIKEGEKGDNEILRKLLIEEDLNKVLEGKDFKKISPKKIALSGKYVEFDHAIKIGDFVFQWRGESLKVSPVASSKEEKGGKTKDIGAKITLAKVISLATVDSINPCALAVLALMLTAILTYNPQDKRKVILAGFSFILAIFILYFIYGILIVKFFQKIQVLTFARFWLYKILGVLALILGVLNIKDFLKYKPGSLLTEMPLSLRPRMRKLIFTITSPKGAFGVGIFVTLFLLPCTIGPYIICGGILCALDFVKVLPFLTLYNLIFILPMVFIVFLVYLGLKNVEDIFAWRERNIRKLHLVAGIIMISLAIIMISGKI